MNEQYSPWVEVEVPSAWCEHPLVGEPHRLFVANLFGILADLDAVVHTKYVRSGDDFVPRTTNSVLFSYHSVGDAPNVWRIKEGPLPYYFSFDRRGYSGWSEIAHSGDMYAQAQQMDLEEARRIVRKAREESVGRNVSKYPQPSISVSNLPSGFVFFPLQITSDTVLKLSRLDYFDVLDAAVRTAQERRQALVIKRHPLCTDEKMESALEKLRDAPFVTITEASVHQCLAGARSVLCCNSGVGFEALLHGKPVFSFGESDYNAAAERIARIEDVSSVFDAKTAVTADTRDRFIAYFLTRYCFDARSSEQIAAKVRHAFVAAGWPQVVSTFRGASEDGSSKVMEFAVDRPPHLPQVALLDERVQQITSELAELRRQTAANRFASSDDLTRASTEISGQFEKMLAERNKFDEDRRHLEDDRRRLEDDRRRLDEIIDSLRADVARAEAELTASRNETRAWQARFDQIRYSRSWRVLAPARYLARRLRGAHMPAEAEQAAVVEQPAEPEQVAVVEQPGPVEAPFGSPGSREYEIIVKSGLFDRDWYLSQYEDIAVAGTDPIEHFLKAGAQERRNPCAFFDAGFYLWVYPDLAESEVNPLLHYIEYGSRENRTPHPLFDVEWFKATTGFDPESDETALAAYLRMAGTTDVWPTNLLSRCQTMLNLDSFDELDGYIKRVVAA
ncbi:hypothetical protein [Caballeronia sp. NCTM5]|uniref:capsular polysaccharide export protein, LipB/KpsS family n=1 Tax=Caballeronia sp. NCTM5 TaxID=2921755 RepID=UPI002028C10A|nr:hypothetical protein [Caballeronia sp. NCTM5]